MIHDIDILEYVKIIGYIGVFLIIFLETGVFLAFFLPGDSLLFAAGILAAQKVFNIYILIIGFILTAILGYILAYFIGEKLGKWLLKKKETFWFKKDYLLQAEHFYHRHGGKALILGRLIPIVRTFVPVVAGIVKMPYQRYMIYNVIGAIIWGILITSLGFYFGYMLPYLSKYILPALILIIIFSFLPALWPILLKRKAKK